MCLFGGLYRRLARLQIVLRGRCFRHFVQLRRFQSFLELCCVVSNGTFVYEKEYFRVRVYVPIGDGSGEHCSVQLAFRSSDSLVRFRGSFHRYRPSAQSFSYLYDYYQIVLPGPFGCVFSLKLFSASA